MNEKEDNNEKISDFYKDWQGYTKSVDNVSIFKDKSKRKRKKLNNISFHDSSIDFIIRFNISEDVSNKLSEGISKVQKALEDLKSDLHRSSKK